MHVCVVSWGWPAYLKAGPLTERETKVLLSKKSGGMVKTVKVLHFYIKQITLKLKKKPEKAIITNHF